MARSYEVGQIRTDRGLFRDKGNLAFDPTHEDYNGGADPDGLKDSSEAFRLADVDADGEGASVRPSLGTYKVASSLTLSGGLSLDEGVVLELPSGVTLTVNGPFRAGAYQCFDVSGGGTVSFGTGAVEYALPEWFGIDGTEDGAEIAIAVVAADIRLIPGRTYTDPGADGRTLTNAVSGRKITATGATLQNISIGPAAGVDQFEVEGGHWYATDDMTISDGSPFVIRGDNITIRGVRITTDPSVVNNDHGWGDAVDIKETALNTSVLDFDVDIIDADVVVIQGSGTIVSRGRIKSSDDGIVIKAATAEVRDTRISDIQAEDNADIVACGTEVAFPVRNTVANNLIGKPGVGYGIYLKPGKPAYQNGLIDGWVSTNITMSDPEGEGFRSLVNIAPESSAKVRGVQISKAIARARGPADRLNTGARIYALGTDGGSEVEIRDVTLDGFDVRDVHDGVALGATDDSGATAVGSPINNLLYVEEVDSGVIVDLVVKNFKGHGCSGHGVFVKCPSLNVVTLDGLDIRQYGRVTTGNGLRINAGVVRLSGPTRIESTSTGSAFSVASGAKLLADSEEFWLGDLAAGTDRTFNLRSFSDEPGRRGYAFRVHVMDEAGVTQSDADYITFSLRKSGAGTDIVSATTESTGGVALTAGVFTALNDDHPSVSGAVAAAHFATTTERLQLHVAHTGSGQALTRARVRVEFAHY